MEIKINLTLHIHVLMLGVFNVSHGNLAFSKGKSIMLQRVQKCRNDKYTGEWHVIHTWQLLSHKI